VKKIGVVVHELARTGSPIVGLSIARFLKEKGHSIHVFAKEGGSLATSDIFRGYTPIPLTVTNTGHTRRPKINRKLAQKKAKEALIPHSFDLLYVNSLAAAEWCLAANELGIPVFFHVHELKPAIKELRRAGIFSFRFRPKLHGLIGASKESVKIGAKTIAYKAGSPQLILTSFVDLKELKTNAELEPPSAYTADGRQLEWQQTEYKPLICMCGSAVYAKGVDIFWETAALCPNYNFVWVGTFDIKDQPANPIFSRFQKEQLDNFFITGPIENPASVFSRCEAMFLSTRQDSNPLVLLEALGVQLPVIGFHQALGYAEVLKSFGMALPGKPNVEAIVGVLSEKKRLNKQRRNLSSQVTQMALRKSISHQEKLQSLYDFLCEH